MPIALACHAYGQALIDPTIPNTNRRIDYLVDQGSGFEEVFPGYYDAPVYPPDPDPLGTWGVQTSVSISDNSGIFVDYYSFVGAALLSATVVTDVTGPEPVTGPYGWSGSSTYHVSFILLAPASYNLTGSLLTTGSNLIAGSTSLSLVGPGTNIAYAAGVGDPAEIINLSGLLLPGSYAFDALGTVSGARDNGNFLGTSSFNFEFMLATVPEPAPISLLAMPLLAMLMRRRR